MRFAEMTAPEIRELPRDVDPGARADRRLRAAQPAPPRVHRLDARGGRGRRRRAEPAADVLLLPVLWLGASEHHLPFGGTLTATLPTYETMLIELLTPLLRDGFRRVMLLNGHGGNIDPLHVALRRLDPLFPQAVLTGAAYWEIAGPELAALCEGPRKTVGHACEIETSMILHLRRSSSAAT